MRFSKLNLPPAKSPQPLTSPTETNDPTASLTETTSPTAAPSPQTSRIWLAPYLPEDFSSSLSLPDGITRSSSLADVDLLVDVGNENLLGEWIFALAAPFSTLTDSITLADLKEILLSDDSEKFPEIKILVDSNTKTLLEKYFKTTDLKNLMVVPSEKLLSTTWQDKNTWAIFPFEKIEPQWKILDVDGQNPLHKDFISSKYPLAIPFSITGNSTAVKVFFNKKALLQQKPISNRDPEKLTTVVLTGVTALVRATASLMESKGMTYPGEDIRLWLREADITHISNEIAYTPKCPPPLSPIPIMCWSFAAARNTINFWKMLERISSKCLVTILSIGDPMRCVIRLIFTRNWAGNIMGAVKIWRMGENRCILNTMGIKSPF